MSIENLSLEGDLESLLNLCYVSNRLRVFTLVQNVYSQRCVEKERGYREGEMQ